MSHLGNYDPHTCRLRVPTCIQMDPSGYRGGVKGQRDVAAVQVHTTYTTEQVFIGRDGMGVVLGHSAVWGLGDLPGCRCQLPVLGCLAGQKAACGDRSPGLSLREAPLGYAASSPRVSGLSVTYENIDSPDDCSFIYAVSLRLPWAGKCP